MSFTVKQIEGQHGFTLIELMIVIVIVAVLVAVALPAYQSSVIKANRGAAQAYLMDIAQKQQLFFNSTRSFAQTEAALSVTPPDRVAQNYLISFEDIDPNSPPPKFTIRAQPTGSQLKDGALTITNTGEKLLRGTDPW